MSANTSHIEELLTQYRSLLPVFEKMAEVIPQKLKEFFTEAGFIVAAVEHRVKTESSLKGKLKLKGDKYRDVFDVTDIVGIRRMSLPTMPRGCSERTSLSGKRAKG